MPLHYPFSAVLGCDPTVPDGLDDMGLALVLTAISPAIGGVLVRGQKGTAKSTTVRALADVLPPVAVREGDRFSADPADPADTSPDEVSTADAPVVRRPVRLVELPVGATEDRVLGSLHLGKALSRGEVEFEPGLLARAHRGLLYVDEVNLLHDHLVDLVLDAAATGNVSVERDGVSLTHRARFVLVGTMNPEEGELRPQLLDRFGLTVEVAAPTYPAQRVEVVQRRLAYDADPAAFVEAWQPGQEQVRVRVAAARTRLGDVHISRAALLKVAEVCAAFEVDGLRADIVTTRTALAHAAWHGRDAVTRADIRAAALLALPHRRRRNPFDAPGLDEALLDQILGDEEPEPDPPSPSDDDGPASERSEAEAGGPAPDSAGESSASTDGGAPEEPCGAAQSPAGGSTGSHGERRSSAGAPYRPRLFTVDGVGEGAPGRRSRARSRNGRRVGARPGATGSLHLVETLRAAADRLAAAGERPRSAGVRFQPADLRTAVREGRESNLLVLVVDASGSMAARRRMGHVKTAVLSL
ncbi:MAG: ATP-binding protein, partial [Nocardioides sp.]|uniref:ATP-binding protein n=1 Tax=Nocardioides sp. TaxID=35761 RepID=UPI003EFF3169